MPKIIKLWCDQAWESDFREAGVFDATQLSQRKLDWFEEPNIRRGGWSGVSKFTFNKAEDESTPKAAFLKIQQNHFYIAPNTLFLKRLTFEREFEVIHKLHEASNATPRVVFYMRWVEDGDQYCAIATESLDDWIPLDKWFQNKCDIPPPSETSILKALESIASTARQIHEAGYIHMCFSAKHLFLKERDDDSFETKVIDFEKTRKRLGFSRRSIKDCSHFLRHTPNLTEQHKIHFLKCYFQTEYFSSKHCRLIQKMNGAPQI